MADNAQTGTQDRNESVGPIASHLGQAMERISELVLALGDLGPGGNPYEIIARHLQRIIPDSVVVASSYDPSTHTARIEAVVDPQGHKEAVSALLGQSPIGATFSLDEAEHSAFLMSELRSVPEGLHQMSAGRIPRWLSGALELVLEVRDFYAMGLTCRQELLGLLAIGARHPLDEIDRVVATSCLKLAAVALKRRRAEEALRQSEEAHRLACEAVKHGILFLDLNGSITFGGGETLRILGTTIEDLRGRPLRDLFPADRREELLALLGRARAGESPGLFETEIQTAAGGQIPIELHLGAHRSPDGTPLGFAGVFREVSGRRRIEADLRASQRMLWTLMSNVPGMAYRCRNEPPWPMEFVSEGATELTGYAPEELSRTGGVPYNDLIHPEDRERVWNEVQAGLKQNGVFQLLYRIVTKDGRERWVWERGRSVPSDGAGPQRLEGFITDVTELRAAQEALRQSEKRYRDLVENVAEGIGIVDPQETFLFANPAAEQIFGVGRGELVGRNLRDFVSAEAYEQVRAETERRRHGEKSSYELSIRRSDGEKRILLVTVVPHFGPEGEFLGAMGILRDVTELRQVEEHRRKLEAQLWEVQKLESLGLLAGGIAHTFNNLLTTIGGYADLARAELGDPSPVAEHLSAILEASAKARELTQQMLVFSGKGHLVLRQVDLARLVEEMRGLLDVVAPHVGPILYHLPAGLPLASVDAGQMRQLIFNLVLNAAEACSGAGGTIEIRVGEQEVSPASPADARYGLELRKGPHVYFEVRDTGRGMPPEVQARMFEPFFSTKFMGRGLGLAAVLGIVKGHGGAIEVQSQLGRGTTVRVLLPAVARIP
jgi:two-component system cell cycle sensor histidine kinase/response regulator CckA